ncbi:efflux transporter outer membrane subunit [Piscinibacter sakaiensis]|uniref:efflux transporter outer membrane subunit n=1 Tax=Piscinibacter sakaiensis TaxID=1547922 RepID=UPI003AAAAF44
MNAHLVRWRAAGISLALTAALAGCAVPPPHRSPQVVPLPAAFKQAIPPQFAAAWKPAEPAETLPRGAWWKVFGDPQLDALVDEATRANASLQAAHARLARARALLGASEAERAPQLDAGAAASRHRPSPQALGLPASADPAPRTALHAGLGASWEIDLFGRVAATIAAAEADAGQAEALLQSQLLVLQADVVQLHFAIRSLDAEAALLERAAALRQDELTLVERRFRAGETSEVDVARARTELAIARADAIAVTRRRAELEHALAVLLGKAPAQLTLAAAPLQFAPISIPAGLPSTLLERRPDIAAAARAVAAANARIGAARAAFFPRVTLGAGFGFDAGEAGDLLRWNSRSWALGPLALSLPIFDGGRNRAQHAAAIAAHDEAAAGYRQTVLQALREVEDQLAALRLLAEQAAQQASAVESARRAAQLSASRYRNGMVSQLEQIDAERTVLASQRAALAVERERALATAGLIRALGGGWSS